MKKIKDRVLLGLISGLGGGLAKWSVNKIARKLKWAKFDGPERAAGLLLSAHRVTAKRGRVPGYLADAAIAGLAGIATVYVLSITGKDKGALKGAITGNTAWSLLYGVLGQAGGTKVGPASPKTILSQAIADLTYGVTTAAIASKLGDPGLFKGVIPLTASSQKLSAAPCPTSNNSSVTLPIGRCRKRILSR